MGLHCTPAVRLLPGGAAGLSPGTLNSSFGPITLNNNSEGPPDFSNRAECLKTYSDKEIDRLRARVSELEYERNVSISIWHYSIDLTEYYVCHVYASSRTTCRVT